jgi:hypothetical protein
MEVFKSVQTEGRLESVVMVRDGTKWEQFCWVQD